MKLIRPGYLEAIRQQFEVHPIVLLTGPRQAGKTTIARELVAYGTANYFDLEDPTDLDRLQDPMINLLPLEGLVVIDEVQRRPDLFPVLRVIADHPERRATFLILGSASGDLLRQGSESLAGRIGHVNISGFMLPEIEAESGDKLWLRGGFPPSFLADSDSASLRWRLEFIQTLLERDFPQWGVRTPATALLRFWRMLAHYHGQTWNASEPAQALDVNHKTTQRYLDILTDAFMVRQLPPYLGLGKRQVKSPKIYMRDSGVVHALVNITSKNELLLFPRIGFSWEGFALEQAIMSVPHDQAYYWGKPGRAEIDLLLETNDELVGYEFKRSFAPGVTRSLVSAIETLGLRRTYVVYPGTKRYVLGESVEAIPLGDVARE